MSEVDAAAPVGEAPAADTTTTAAEEKPAAEEATAQTDAAENETPTECTVFQNPSHYTIKHPLRHNWTLWYDIPVTKVAEKDWLDTLKQVYTFRYVEDFWGYVFVSSCTM